MSGLSAWNPLDNSSSSGFGDQNDQSSNVWGGASLTSFGGDSTTTTSSGNDRTFYISHSTFKMNTNTSITALSNVTQAREKLVQACFSFYNEVVQQPKTMAKVKKVCEKYNTNEDIMLKKMQKKYVGANFQAVSTAISELNVAREQYKASVSGGGENTMGGNSAASFDNTMGGGTDGSSPFAKFASMGNGFETGGQSGFDTAGQSSFGGGNENNNDTNFGSFGTPGKDEGGFGNFGTPSDTKTGENVFGGDGQNTFGGGGDGENTFGGGGDGENTFGGALSGFSLNDTNEGKGLDSTFGNIGSGDQMKKDEADASSGLASLGFPSNDDGNDTKLSLGLPSDKTATTFGDEQEQTSSSLSFPTGENDTKTDKESFSIGLSSGTKDDGDDKNGSDLAFPTSTTFGDEQEQTSSLSFPTGENDTKTDKESFSMGGLAFPSGNNDGDNLAFPSSNTIGDKLENTPTSSGLSLSIGNSSNDTKTNETTTTANVENLGVSSSYFGVSNSESKYLHSIAESNAFAMLKHFGGVTKQKTTKFVKNNLLKQVQEQITYSGEPSLTVSECIRAGFIMTDISSRSSQLPSGVTRGTCEGDDSGCEATLCMMMDSKLYVAQTGRSVAFRGRLGSRSVTKISGSKVDPKSCFGNYRYKVEDATEIRSVEPDVSVVSDLSKQDFVLLVSKGLLKSLGQAGIEALVEAAESNESLCKSLVSSSSSAKSGCLVFNM
mgnify:CR=1 FL=1